MDGGGDFGGCDGGACDVGASATTHVDTGGAHHDGGAAHVASHNTHNTHHDFAYIPYDDSDESNKRSNKTTARTGPSSYDKFIKRNKSAGLAIAIGSTGLGLVCTYDAFKKMQAQNQQPEGEKSDNKSNIIQLIIGIGLTGFGLFTGNKVRTL